MRRAMRKLKDRKAMGIDGIPNEVWKYGGGELEDWARNFVNRLWKGDGWPERWKEGVIIPIVKKGVGRKVEECMRITVTPSLYKVYVSILKERLREEVEVKKIIPDNQTGFRKGMGTLDNVYVLIYLVNRNLERRGGKLVAFFIDLKSAFDRDREVLVRSLREWKVREGFGEKD